VINLLLTLLTFVTFSARADELTLTFIRSPLGIDWKTPYTMAISTVANSAVPMKQRAFSISHLFVNLKCDSQNYERLTGMTSTTNEDRDLLFKEGYGYGIIFHTYPGKLERDADVARDLEDYKGSRRVARMRLKISESTCARLKTYLNEYEARGFGALYSGLQARPRRGEGAGCSAFGMSFLELAGLLQPEWSEQWMNHIHVPKRFVGGPITGKFIRIREILAQPFSRWNPKRQHIYLEAWNPEKMWKWTKEVWADVRFGRSKGEIDWEISKVGKTREIYADMSSVPTPTDPIWQY
jgi:hypothetical protein